MTVIRKFGFCFFTVVILLSCGNSKNKNNTDNKIDKIAQELASKYNAITNWDTTLAYTSFYQEIFIDENRNLLFKGRLYDIVKEDSTYVFKVLNERENSSRNFLALISFTSQQFDDMFTSDKSTRGIFIINVSKITSSNPSIKVDEESDGEYGSYTYSYLNDDDEQMITIFKGRIVDCYFEKFEEKK